MLESHGNANLIDKYGNEIGIQRVTSALHFGPSWNDDAFQMTIFSKTSTTNYADHFHKYAFKWDDNGIQFSINDTEIGYVPVNDGFWQRGGFKGENIWTTNMAPFDQEVEKFAFLFISHVVSKTQRAH